MPRRVGYRAASGWLGAESSVLARAARSMDPFWWIKQHPLSFLVHFAGTEKVHCCRRSRDPLRADINFVLFCEMSQGSAGYDDHRPLRHSECGTMSGRLVTNLGRRPATASAVAASRRRLVRGFHFPAFLLHGIERRYLCPAFAQHSPQCTQQAGILSAGHGSYLQSSGQIRFRRPVSRAPSVGLLIRLGVSFIFCHCTTSQCIN
jgi:hypothetical protein